MIYVHIFFTDVKRTFFTKCLLIFLRQNAKKKILEKLIRKKIQKNFIVNDNHKIIRAWYLREAPGEHTYLPKKSEIFQVKIVRNCFVKCFCITKIRLGEISSRKRIQMSNLVKIKNPTMIRLNRIQLPSQTTNYVKRLSSKTDNIHGTKNEVFR